MDRCYDFKNIFAEEIRRKKLLHILTQITAIKVAKGIITLGFKKNANFFHRKWVKIAENIYHNIDPR
jgi:hypothetical protein